MFDSVLNQDKFGNALDFQDQLVLLSSSGHIEKIRVRNWIMSDDLLPHQILVEGSRM